MLLSSSYCLPSLLSFLVVPPVSILPPSSPLFVPTKGCSIRREKRATTRKFFERRQPLLLLLLSLFCFFAILFPLFSSFTLLLLLFPPSALFSLFLQLCVGWAITCSPTNGSQQDIQQFVRRCRESSAWCISHRQNRQIDIHTLFYSFLSLDPFLFAFLCSQNTRLTRLGMGLNTHMHKDVCLACSPFEMRKRTVKSAHASA